MKKVVDYVADVNKFIVDWVTVSFRTNSEMTVDGVIDGLCKLLACSRDSFVHFDNGFLAGYNNSFRYLSEKWLVVSYNIDNAKQGILVNLTGQGCRMLGKEVLFELLKWFIENDGYFTRLDIAFDDVDQKLPIHLIRNCAEAIINYGVDDSLDYMVASKVNKESFKAFSTPYKSKYNVSPNITLGSRYSTCMVRYYNKALEQKKRDMYWWRCELQLKYGLAETMAIKVLDGSFVTYFVELLNKYSRFLVDNRSSAISKVKTHSDFQAFLDYLLGNHEFKTSLNLYLRNR